MRRKDAVESRFLTRVIAQGAALGLAFSACEDLLNLNFHISFRFDEPLQVSLLVLVVDVIVAILASLVASPVLRIADGRAARWHRVTTFLLFAAIVLTTPAQMANRVVLDTVLLAATAVVLWLSTRWCAARRRRVASCVVLALSVVLVCGELPGWWSVWTSDSASHAATVVPASERATAPGDAPNVLFLVLDTVRKDRTGLAGYDRDTLPSIDALATEGVSFARALSPAGWTVPSHASMFTGLYPSTHGAHHEWTYLDSSFDTLAERFARAGWSTVALSSNPWVSRATGLAQGFDTTVPVWADGLAMNYAFAYRLLWALGLVENDHGGRRTAARWASWLARHAERDERPFFAFVNLVETHMSYHQIPQEHLTRYADDRTVAELVASSRAVNQRILAGRPIESEESTFGDLSAIYDGGLRYVDALVTDILGALDAAGVAGDTLVVVVADHGDHLGERGMVHHTRGLTEQLLSVPLVLRFPGKLPAGRTIDTPVTTASLAPTVLELAGLEVPDGLQVASLGPLLRGEDEAPRSPLLAEQYRDQHEIFGDWVPTHPFDRLGMRWRTLEEDGWKLVVASDGGRWLFRPSKDPLEIVDLKDDHPDVVRHLQTRLDALVSAYGLGALDRELDLDPASAPEIDEATEEQLRSLGYL